MFWAEIECEFLYLSSLQFSLSWFDSIMCVLILQRDDIRILGFIKAPVVRHQYRTCIFYAYCALTLTRWIRIIKVQSTKRIRLEVNLTTIYLDHIEIKHGSVPGQFVEL